MEIIKCGCKTGCNQGRCQCNKSKMKCSDLCQCTNCENKDVRSNIIDAEDEQPDEDDDLDSIYLDDT